MFLNRMVTEFATVSKALQILPTDTSNISENTFTKSSRISHPLSISSSECSYRLSDQGMFKNTPPLYWEYSRETFK